jgi:hypothetical protein
MGEVIGDGFGRGTGLAMSTLEFFLLTRALTQISNTMELIIFFGKHQKLHIPIKLITLKTILSKNVSKNKTSIKVKT